MTIAVLGEALVDLIGDESGSFAPHLGGSPYNVAVGLARQGLDVRYLCPLSDDVFGDLFNAAVRREGIALTVTRRSSLPTSLAVVSVANGAADYRLYRQGVADIDYEPADLVAALDSGISLFHTGSLALTPDQVPRVRQLAKAARDRGITVSVDINVRLRAVVDSGAYLRGIRSLLPLADIVKASDEDLAAFELENDIVAVARQFFQEMAGEILLLTRGGQGTTLLTPSGAIVQPAYQAGALVDTIGAGDTFFAAFLAGLCHRDCLGKGLAAATANDIQQALTEASAAAAINVSRRGCDPPTREEVAAFLGKVSC